VARWANSPADETPVNILREHAAQVPDSWREDIEQLPYNEPTTEASIRRCVATTVEQHPEVELTDAEAAAIVASLLPE
jgi:hypothetical protein